MSSADLNYARHTHGASNFFQRFSHGSRFQVACDLIDPRPDQSILDFGGGDGFMVHQLHKQEPKASYVSYDPDKRQVASAREMLALTDAISADTVPEQQFDTVCCLETLEHVPDAVVPAVLQQIKDCLKPGGRLVVSVPIEIGLAAMGKQLVRAITGQREKRATLWRIILSILYMPPEAMRTQDDPGHAGFDYRKVKREMIAAGFVIKRTVYSPLPLGPVVNSQVFWVCTL